MDRPDYSKNTIVNLMASILRHFSSSSPYPSLSLPIFEPQHEDSSVILIVIDGMGYNFLQKEGKDSYMGKKVAGKLSSTFPSTTAAAMTSFYTGLAPLNHAVPAWFTYLRELGCVATILPFVVRHLRTKINSEKISPEEVFNITGLFEGLDLEQNIVVPENLVGKPYGNVTFRGRRQIGYKSLDGMVDKLIQIANHASKKHFTLAYYPDFDSTAHDNGINHHTTKREFQKIDFQIKRLINALNREPNSTTKVIITADHGLIDVDEKHTIWLSDHPELEKCLVLPLCGEPRAPFLYFRASKLKQGLAYIRNNLSDIGTLVRTSDFINQNVFGLGSMHPEFESRVGDYILIMKDNYIFRDALLGEERHRLIGNHGGLDAEELYVPLIIFP